MLRILLACGLPMILLILVLPNLAAPGITCTSSSRMSRMQGSIERFAVASECLTTATRTWFHWRRSQFFFARWKQGKCDAVHQESTPLSLLILCALRYLGRGWTFDDLSENTCISEEVIRIFFHQFILFGSTELYEKFVVTPNNC